MSFAVHAVQELAAANPALRSLGYDDGCHLAEVLARHPERRLRSLDIWIDLFHLFGHVRTKCFLDHNPLTRLDPADRVTLTITSETCRNRILSHIDIFGKVQRHRSARFGWLWQGGRGRCMRLHAVGQMSCHHACHALAEFAASPLPIQIEIKHPARSDPIFLILATARARSRFLNALDILSGRLLRVIQIQKVRLPRHSQFATWSQQDAGLPVRTHYVASRINLVEHLRGHPLPVTVTFLYGQNTSVAEQNWVHFNKFRHTMRAMGRGGYLLFAHRVVHVRNGFAAARL